MTQSEITAAAVYELFHEFCAAYGAEWARLNKCERLYHGDHWHGIPETDRGEPRPATPIIQSTIENMRADLMDSYPEAIIVADDPAYAEAAELLSAAVKENHTRGGYSREYGKLTHDLLVGGYMVQETGYDPLQNGGLGGAFIRQVDPRGIVLDPLCDDVQDCRAIFKFRPYPRAWFEQHYPGQAAAMDADSPALRPLRDALLAPTDAESILLLECWQREYDAEQGRCQVHMQKLAGGVLLEDSRGLKPEGYFAHGEYPFVLTSLYPRKGSCLGYGLVDMFERTQLYSDKLDQIVLKNALMASHNKLLVTGASGFDVGDLRDWSKEVHKGENLNGVTWFPTAPLPAYLVGYVQAMRESIKQESGVNDFSRGMTSGGVTAASAIAALQEMSSKRSRMAARAIYDAFEMAVRQEIEVEREFCTLERSVLPQGGARRAFCGKLMQRKTALGNWVPLEFSVSVKVQRENRFAVAAHNELMLSLVRLGMLTPDIGMELMLFDGKAQAQALMQKKLAEFAAQAQSEAKGDGAPSPIAADQAQSAAPRA
ncbi:MAG: hypothetical protein LBN26_05385 [Christensenellaceae bacterium]|nr:hypothetical protein [Christensenellaceae bacterium]